ncbi:MAG: flavodoxin domain-containing protein, partial [Clostridia bacterium]|nr:flavodoxin domain-containing protein [Clostridia bacterium]
RFVFAPMVHWPEVMFTYDETSQTLFSADAFGTFGALGGSIFADEVDFEREYLDDARRYYLNIVGKYGVQVQNVLKKASALKIQTVCPLHGPVWRTGFEAFLAKYVIWSGYEPEEKGVAVFYASVYGHTQNAAEILARELVKAGVKQVKTYDVSVTHASELLSEAFRYSHVVFAAPTYNNAIFPSMENLLNELKSHNYQNRKYAVIENGSWAPQSGGLMQAVLSGFKNVTQLGEKITVLSAVHEGQRAALETLALAIAKDFSA